MTCEISYSTDGVEYHDSFELSLTNIRVLDN